MFHISTRLIPLLAIAAMLGSIVAACGPTTFDPAAPCTEDGRFAGAYPVLESMLLDEYDGRAPDGRDSGRNCEPGSLGTLATRGVDELRYAGAVWDLGAGAAVSQAVLEADGLEADWVAEFYEAGARAGRRVEEVTVSDVGLGNVTGTRIDALNGESFQTVVVGQGNENQVRVAIVANPIRQIQTREAHGIVVDGAIDLMFAEACCN